MSRISLLFFRNERPRHMGWNSDFETAQLVDARRTDCYVVNSQGQDRIANSSGTYEDSSSLTFHLSRRAPISSPRVALHTTFPGLTPLPPQRICFGDHTQ
jgi:hypothetical protein